MNGAVDGTVKTLAFVVICVAYVKSMRCGKERYQWQFGQVFFAEMPVIKRMRLWKWYLKSIMRVKQNSLLVMRVALPAKSVVNIVKKTQLNCICN